MVGSAHDKLVGRSLGEFVLRERIGEGGFGAVYRAIQPVLDRHAVVKVLHARLHASTAASERFLREAKLASSLDHPYAAHIYAFGAESDGQLWIAMELVRGTPLDQILKSQGPLSLERFVPLLDRICEVVHTAHEQGIVHRDLKPANVMVLARAGRLLPKLLDFGIAKDLAKGSDDQLGETVVSHSDLPALEVSGDQATLAQTLEARSPPTGATPRSLDLTERGVVMGSPHYMAPEQWLDAGQVDGRTDLYALGIVAYECLTGKPPFTGTTITQLSQAHATQAPPPLGPRFPAALDRVFAKVLAKRAEDRYGDALAFAVAFRHASGLSPEAVSLPELDPARRDEAINGAPQPIAEVIAALAAARNAHQARDAAVEAARAITRYLGLLALACRSRVSGGDEPPAVGQALRTLYRKPLADAEWLALAHGLTRPWTARRDAYPIPELVDAFHERSVVEDLEWLDALRDREVRGDEALLELLEKAMTRLSRVLERLAFVADYALVVTISGGVAERWMGVRRTQRTTMHVHGKGLPVGVPALIDGEGVPVVSLAPLFQLAAPTPGAPLELFLFEGRDARGARLTSLPGGFEHHDDELWDWFRVQLSDSLDDMRTAISDEKSPYRGLSSFSTEDGASFFGREKQVDAFVNRLKLQPLLAVVGRSGAGKSSFVYAGVIPALGWRAITMRPGPSPLGTLVARLEHAAIAPAQGDLRAAIAADRNALGALLRADASERGPIVLVIDQLEEMFTLCQDGDERRVFAEAIAAAARGADDPVRVVFTLRDDFLVRTEQVPALRNRIGQGLQLLTVPVAEDLRRILTEPARRAGYELEGDLAQEMVREVADQPGALPLISFTASKLWDMRDRQFRLLTRSAYKTLGGVGGALARHADVTLDEMRPEERAIAREAFRHLVTTQNTRAVLTRKDLRQLLGGDRADPILEKLIAARLLVASENEAGAETIEIVHEALLVAWPRLVEWRRDDAEGARFREQLRAAAAQWHERGRAKGLVWRGDALADYTRWRARHPGPLTDIESAFANASLDDATRSRRTRRLLLGTAFASLLALVAGLIVFNARIDRQRAQAESAALQLHDNLQRQYENQGRIFVLEDEPLKALAYLAKAAELGSTGWAHDFLIAQAVSSTEGEILEVRHDGPVRSPRFSHDGKRLITASLDRTARIWDAATGALLLKLPHDNVVARASFSPDDATALTASFDGAVIWWDATTGRQLHRFQHHAPVWCAQFSPDGQVVLTAGEDGDIVIWELPAARERFRVHDDGGGARGCSFSPDGTTIAVGERNGKTHVIDVRTGRTLHVLEGQHNLISDVRFSPDGARLLTASWDGTAAEWNVATGERLAVFAHKSGVYSVDFSRDGRLALTASVDQTAVIWDAMTSVRLHTLQHTGGVTRALFSHDGRYVFTTADDASALLWDASSGRVLARWRSHSDRVYDGDFDASGARAVTASDDGKAIVWKVQPQQDVVPLAAHTNAVQLAKFSPDGRTVVTGSSDGLARVEDPASGRELWHSQFRGSILGASFSPDSRALAIGSTDGVVHVLEAETGAERRTLTGATTVLNEISWSPDGALLVAASNDGSIRCWDYATGRLRFEKHGGAAVRSAQFHPSGKRIITAAVDGVARVWDVDGNLLNEHSDPDTLFSAAYDPSGSRVLSSVARGAARIWNAETGATEVQLVGNKGQVVAASWSPDGRMAVTTGDGTVRLWDTETGDNIATYRFAAGAIIAGFSPDGRRFVVGDDSGGAAIYTLPRYQLSPTDLVQLLRCRVPFEVQGERLQPRDTDPTGCPHS